MILSATMSCRRAAGFCPDEFVRGGCGAGRFLCCQERESSEGMGRDFVGMQEQREAEAVTAAASARTVPKVNRTEFGGAGLAAATMRMQRMYGNRATTALMRGARRPAASRPLLQRTEESAALLTELATPQTKTGPAVGAQKRLVERLNAVDTFDGAMLNLGGILIEEMPKSDGELLTTAEFVELPTSGGFISAGRPRSRELKEAGLAGLVLENTLKTMIDAKQVEYLRKAGLPNAEWKILVEVHFYRERDMSATGLHKDTLTETLFVNLNYHMDKAVVGPEYVINPQASEEHDQAIKATLPASFLEDLGETRKRLGGPTEIGTRIVQPYGYVAFVDEAVHHATPYYWQRFVKASDLTEFLGRDPKAVLTEYLKTNRTEEFAAAGIAYSKWLKRWTDLYSFDAFDDRKLIRPEDSGKWLAAMQLLNEGTSGGGDRLYTRNDLALMLDDNKFDALLERVATDPEKGKARTGGAAGGFHTAQIPRPGQTGYPIAQPIKATDKPPLKRRLSNPDFRKQLPPAPEDKEKRCFFRSWVRVVKKEKVADLRKRI